jgi:hypothetical protein
MELTGFEEPTELMDVEVIGGHVGILSVPFSRDLVYHEVRISEAENPPDANLLGQLEPVHQGLILGDIVLSGEVDLQHVVQLVSLGRYEEDASSQSLAHLGPIKVHAPIGGVQSRR